MAIQDINKQLENIKGQTVGIQRGLSQFQTPETELLTSVRSLTTPESLTGEEHQIRQTTGKAQTILEKYLENQKKRIESESSEAKGEELKRAEKEKIGVLESRRGFGTNTALMRELEDTSRRRLEGIEKVRNKALLEADESSAGKLAELAIKEQEMITDTRKAFFSRVFDFLGFETPQQKRERELQTEVQKSVINLASKAPGIVSPDDDLETALEKYKTSPVYKNDIVKGSLELDKLRADIAKTNADAAKARMDANSVLQLEQSSDPRIQSFNNAIRFISPDATDAQRKDILKGYYGILQSGDAEQTEEYVKKVARSVAPATEQISAIKRNQLLKQIGAIQSAFEQYKEQGGDTGLFIGTKEAIIRRLGRTSDPDLVKIGSSIITAMQNLRVDITGAAFGENEQKEYNNLFPRMTNQMNINDALLETISNSIQRFDDSFYASMIGESNFSNLFGKTPDILGGRTRTLSSPKPGESLTSNNLFADFFKGLGQ